MKRLIFLAQVTLLLLSASLGMAQAPSKIITKSTAASRLDVLILKGNPTLVTLRAENVRLAEVAARLAQKLNVPVQVSPKLKLTVINSSRTKLPLETLATELAPQAYFDYVLSGGRDAYPSCRAIYLQAQDEAAPAGAASVQPRSEAILFEGDTEDSITSSRAKASDEPPLQVSLLQGRLNVRARQQPLTVVLAEIARQCQISFELRHEARSQIDLDFQGVPLTSFPQAFPPEVQFYYRINLRTLAAKPLHLRLIKPDPIEKTHELNGASSRF